MWTFCCCCEYPLKCRNNHQHDCGHLRKEKLNSKHGRIQTCAKFSKILRCFVSGGSTRNAWDSPAPHWNEPEDSRPWQAARDHAQRPGHRSAEECTLRARCEQLQREGEVPGKSQLVENEKTLAGIQAKLAYIYICGNIYVCASSTCMGTVLTLCFPRAPPQPSWPLCCQSSR